MVKFSKEVIPPEQSSPPGQLPLAEQVIDPADLNSAYQGLLNQKDRYVGVVLDWEHNPAPSASL